MKKNKSDDERREAIIQRDLVAVHALPKLVAALDELPSRRAKLLALHGLVIFYDDRAAARLEMLCSDAIDDELYAAADPSGSATRG